ILVTFIKASAFSFLIIAFATIKSLCRLPSTGMTYLIGISSGLFFAGIEKLLYYLLPSTQPLWADYNAIGTFFPFYAVITSLFFTYITTTIGCLIISSFVDYITNHEQKKQLLSSFLFVFLGIAIYGLGTFNNTLNWLVTGTIMGSIIALSYYVIIRFDRGLIPLITGTILILYTIQQAAFNAFPAAIIIYIIAAVIIAIASVYWFNCLQKNRT
ncbi:MAG: hypothetical protein WCD44_00140, partial [Candidatus Babeliales bacterium]